jgi:PPK2 family polyphosphate:nucleotide phosphotransferase
VARSETSLGQKLIVKPGTKVRLDRIDPDDTHGYVKDKAASIVTADLARLGSLQEAMWAENKHRLLIILQGIDTAGKGGTIAHVMGAFNPQGCRVRAFKVPTAEELAHDYLWRVHPHVPGNGEISIFDRSHYEQVLVVRVMGLEPKDRWRQHYDEINDFERLLVDDGTTILKFFLVIDKDEQRKRLQERIDNPKKRWKFRMGDLETRKHWDEYIEAFEDALTKCSTERAPWYVIPANHNWFRNLAVARIVAETLEKLDPQIPPPVEPIPPGLKVE